MSNCPYRNDDGHVAQRCPNCSVEDSRDDKSREEQFTAWLKENEYAPYSSRRDDLWRAWNAGAMFVKSSTAATPSDEEIRQAIYGYEGALAEDDGDEETVAPARAALLEVMRRCRDATVAPSATMRAEPTEQEVELAAMVIAESPLIDAPKLPAPSWMGLARLVLKAGLFVRNAQSRSRSDIQGQGK